MTETARQPTESARDTAARVMEDLGKAHALLQTHDDRLKRVEHVQQNIASWQRDIQANIASVARLCESNADSISRLEESQKKLLDKLITVLSDVPRRSTSLPWAILAAGAVVAFLFEVWR